MTRPLKWIALALAGMAVLALAALLGINADDDAPDPLALRYGEPRAPQVADADNGYLRLIALDAPAGADATAWAREWIAESRAAGLENRPERHADTPREELPLLCDPLEQDCIAQASATPAAFESALQARGERLARYEALLAAPGYEEILDFPQRITTSFPDYPAMMDAQRAWLARAARVAASGDIATALDALRRDLAATRRMIEGSRTLLGRTVLAGQYWRDLAFLSALLQAHAAAVAPELAQLRELPGSADFLVSDFAPLVESEFALGKPLLRDPMAAPVEPGTQGPGAIERAVFRFGYKPQATINAEVRRLQQVTAALAMPFAEGSAALERLAAATQAPGPLAWLDNPAGRILLQPTGGYDENAYQRLRFHDTLGFARLVAIQLAWHAEGQGDVPALLAALGARACEPYAGAPMQWDPSTRRLGFTARSPQLRARERANASGGFVFVTL